MALVRNAGKGLGFGVRALEGEVIAIHGDAVDGAGTDVLLAVSWESFSDFGKWWDAYPSSDVAQMERETMTCHGSMLWESEEI